MSRTNTRNKTTVGMLGVALAGGMFLASSAFAVQPLAQGYLASVTQLASAGEGKCGEGKCGEGKCGSDSADGKVSSAEGKCGEGKCGEGKCGDASFAKTDTDKDGRVSRAEFLAVAAQRAADFDKIDTDHDGHISEAEAHAYLRITYEANGKPMPKGLFSHITD